ncbi:NigD-like protein [Parabacteroides sp. AM08-6]|uniref:NigD-like protein n=1 Tax=Parabacteroides sp. AM08-6 TaxID=2292053 RepID=UPI001F42521F|nr:NigD-like protein [Parabacteroides sp. AM08-6]
MKRLRIFVLMLGAVLMIFSFNSCLDDDKYPADRYWIRVATVKPTSSTSYYIQLDDSTTLLPVDGSIPYFGLDEERRALVNFTLLSDSIKGYSHAVKVNQIDSILTKSIASGLGAENNVVYGKDPVSLDYVWIAGNYITFQFRTYFGGVKKHYLNLVQTNEKKPYELEFRHHAYDDPKTAEGVGLISFRLNSLPDTEGETVKLKIKCNTFSGDRTYELDYNSAQRIFDPGPSPSSINFQIPK